MKFILLFLIAVLVVSIESRAQYGSVGSTEARSTGMAKTYSATAAGINSVGINPANLIYSKFSDFELALPLPLPRISARAGTDFLSLNEFNYFFGGVNGNSRMLNEADKIRLDNLFKDGGFVFSNISANLFSIAYRGNDDFGAIAFSISDFAGGKINFPQALVNIALTGNQKNKVYSMSSTNVKLWWIRDYTFTFAKKIFGDKLWIFNEVNGGISLKIVHGFFYVGSSNTGTYFETSDENKITGKADQVFNTSFSTNFGVKYDFDSTDHKGSFSMFPAPAGAGFGVDLGVSAELEDHWKIALAVNDIGGITWSKNAARYKSAGNINIDDLTDPAQRDTLTEIFKGKGEPVDQVKTGLPAVLRIGVQKSFYEYEGGIPGNLVVAIDYNQGFNDLPGNSVHPRFSFGAEWKPHNWIPYLRTGISVGGADGFNWAIGVGFKTNILELNFATSDFQTIIVPNDADKLSFSIGSFWKF